MESTLATPIPRASRARRIGCERNGVLGYNPTAICSLLATKARLQVCDEPVPVPIKKIRIFAYCARAGNELWFGVRTILSTITKHYRYADFSVARNIWQRPGRARGNPWRRCYPFQIHASARTCESANRIFLSDKMFPINRSQNKSQHPLTP